MSRGTIHFLGENVTVTVFTDQIFARNEISSATLIIPYKVELAGFRGNKGTAAGKVDVLNAKGQLRTKDSSIKLAESVTIRQHSLSGTQLSYECQFWFSVTHETISKLEKYRRGDLPLSLQLTLQAALYDEMVFSGGQ